MDHQTIRMQRKRGAFTIIELLVVIGIIAVLAGIFFGVADGVRERGRISRAETELGLIAQYLEQYKAHYGDYPYVAVADSKSASSTTQREGEDGNVALYDALNGWRAVDGTDLRPDRQRAVIDRSKFEHAFTPSLDPPTPTDPEEDPVALIDPWGQAYRYFYDKTSGTWENPSYVVYSVGPDGVHEEPDTKGYADKTEETNLDNIYAK